MSLNPSNMIAEQVNGGTSVFRNICRSVSQRYSGTDANGYRDVLLPNAQQIFEETNAAVIAELVDAGFPEKISRREGYPEQGPFLLHQDVEHIRLSNGSFPEVPTAIYGFYNGWKFERAWYYYRANGDGIPPDIAEEFHKTWGRQVRVEGHCGCPSPLEWCHGFAVGSYHIDTPAGLKAFVQLLDRIYRR